MKKIAFLCCVTSFTLFTTSSFAETSIFRLDRSADFKRYSLSIGALHVMPQGKAQAPKIKSAIKEGEVAKNGDIQVENVFENLDPAKEQQGVELLLKIVDAFGGTLGEGLSGTSKINGIESWTMHGAGMEADDVTTLGMMFNYHINDNLSFESKLGVPPKVDINGIGNITAPFTATATPSLQVSDKLNIPIPGLEIALKNDLQITNLGAHGKVAEARAWTPMWEMQYHFGKSGVNKFRPYVGLGVMLAYFNELEVVPGLEKDLIDAGHMIANIKNGKGGDALAKKPSSANPKVELEADLAVAPIATLGFTYDFNKNWFAVSSISYAHLTGKTTIEVNDDQLGTLFSSDVKLEINPIISYAGIGYRF